MEAFHHNCLHQIFRYNYYVHGPVSNEEIRKEAGNAYTIETTMELRRCRWLEKVANMDDDPLPKNYWQLGVLENLIEEGKECLLLVMDVQTLVLHQMN